MSDTSRVPLSRGRRAYWLPLTLLGLAWMGMAVGPDAQRPGWSGYAPLQPGGNDLVFAPTPEVELTIGPFLVDATVVGVFVVFLITLLWYAVCVRRLGAPIGASRLVLALGGGVVFAAVAVLMLDWLRLFDSGFRAQVGVPLLLLGLLTGGWAMFRLGPFRRCAMVVAAIVLPLVGYGAIVAVLPWYAGLLLAAAGLSLLAWLERSRVLAGVAGAIVLAGLVAPAGDMAFLLPAAILMIGAIGALVASDRPDPLPVEE